MKGSPDQKCVGIDDILNVRPPGNAGSVWDTKYPNNGRYTWEQLRHLVGKSVVEFGHTIRDVADSLKVSTGFVGKWSGIYRAAMERRKNDPGFKIKSCMKSQSNRPKHIHSPVRDSVRGPSVELRRRYPFYGADKIKVLLRTKVSTSTINKALRESGMMRKPKQRHRNLHYGSFERPFSNDLWQIDFKMWDLGIKSIWILDDHSRAVLGHRVEARQSADLVIELLESAIAAWGKPRQILSDHGTEFYSVRRGKKFGKLAVWCQEHGIELIHGRVKHPQTQGKIERSHGSATRELLYLGRMDTLEDARKTISEWVEFYNTERPHQAIGYEFPMNRYLADRIDLFQEFDDILSDFGTDPFIHTD